MTENNTLIINKNEHQTDLDSVVPEVDEYEIDVMNYITLLHPDDKLYLNFKNIYTDGNQFIKNYKSESYTSYVKERNTLYNTYSTKKDKYYIEVYNEEIKVFSFKDNKLKIDKYKSNNLSLVKKLSKPSVVIDLSNELKKQKNSLQQYRYKLQTEYKKLSNDSQLDTFVKNNFIKKRNIFSKNLNQYYTYLYYYNKINGILSNNENILLNNMIYYFPENVSTPIPRLSNKNVNIKPDIITDLNKIDSQILNNYYQVLENLNNPSLSDKEKRENIKSYLISKGDNKELLKTIKAKMNKKQINLLVK